MSLDIISTNGHKFILIMDHTELRTPFIFSSNTHLFKGTKGHFYQFRNKHLIFWVITNCTFLLF